MKVTRLPYDPGPAAWNAILPETPAYPALKTHEITDFLVIGGGFAGLSAARRLQQLQPNAKIILLEARRIAEGPAGRNSGFMIDLPHNLSSKDYAGSLEADRRQIEMNRHAIGFASEAAEEFLMTDEAFAIRGKINAAATISGVKHNEKYSAHLTKIGEEYSFLDAIAMRELSGSSYYLGGFYTPGTAMIQPALYIRLLAKGIISKGLKIHENSPVISFQRGTHHWSVKTDKGSISANKVVLAVNGHAESFGFFKRRLMHIYLYGSMTRALTADEVKQVGGEQRWGFTPADPLGSTVRRISGTGGDRIVVRNRFTWAPGRTVSADKLKQMAHQHDKSFQRRFPGHDKVEMEYRWGGLLCLSRNNVPAFGELERNLYSACCQNGLGTAMGTLHGKLAADLACKQTSPFLETIQNLPDPQKLPPEPFSTIGANAYMRWGEMKAGKEL